MRGRGKGGQVVTSGDQLNYTPKQGFTGQDKIWYVIEDAQGRTNWGEITINVSETTTAAPVTNPDTVMVNTANQVASKAVYYIHNNHLGAPEAITDQQQSVAWRANYSPYGEAQIITESIQNNIRLPGQYFDAETDLHYNYFRYYDPKLGRYVTSDPIGLAGGINTYGYVGGNPTNFVDPYGLYCFSFDKFANNIRDNRSNTAVDLAALTSTLAFGTMPKTPAELRGLGVPKNKLNPTTNQLSRRNGRLSRLTNGSSGRVLRNIGRSAKGIVAGSLATGALIFDGFYNWGVVAKSAFEATSSDDSVECECN